MLAGASDKAQDAGKFYSSRVYPTGPNSAEILNVKRVTKHDYAADLGISNDGRQRG